MPDIVVVGSVVADLITRVDRPPGPGETVIGSDLTITPGGKGANQAATASRLGADVALVATVGMDEFGELCIAALVEAGVDTSYVKRTRDASTGCGIVVVDRSGENRIVFSGGANAGTDPDRVEEVETLIRSATLVLIQLEIPIRASTLAASFAQEAGGQVLLNPAPATVPLEGLPTAEIIIPNEIEASQLTGIDVREDASAREAAAILERRGFRSVVITLGEYGAAVFDAQQPPAMIGASRVEAIDTTGAGDAFIGGLAWALCNDRTLTEAAEVGCAVAAEVIRNVGAQPAIRTAAEIIADNPGGSVGDI